MKRESIYKFKSSLFLKLRTMFIYTCLFGPLFKTQLNIISVWN